MDGNLGNIPGTLKESAGLALFGLSALDSLRSPGGLQNLLRTRALLTQDPGARAALQGSPFLSGALGFTGGFAPETPPGIAATRMQQAGISPGTFVPSMGRLNPEEFVASRLAGAQAQALSDPDVMAQAARHTLGIQPPGLTPEQLESYRGAMGPGETLNVPVGGGARMGLRGRFAGGGEAPFGYIRDDVTGRLVRDPRIAGARAPGAGTVSPSTPALPGYVRDPATGKLVIDRSPEAAVAHAQALQAVKDQGITNTTKVMRERAPTVVYAAKRVLALLDRVRTGPFAGRWQELITTEAGLRNPDYRRLRTDLFLLTSAITQMHVGSRVTEHVAEGFNKAIGETIQDPDNLRASLDEVLQYAAEVQARGTPGSASRLGPQAPVVPTEVPMQTTPGGNSYRVLGE